MSDNIEPLRGQIEDTLLIRGKEISVRTTTMRQDTLQFFAENPRIYSILRKQGGANPTQEEIQKQLLDMDHVKELIQDIKRDSGLTDPIIVKEGTLEVLEGNSRLAAYRHLVTLDPIKWGMIKVRLLPKDLDEKLILALLGQYHLKGKTPWPPYEKAGFLYRRHKNHDIPVEQLALEVGETRSKVAHMVNVYQFMIDHDEDEKSRWSYYDEFIKSRIIKKARNEKFDKLIVENINSGDISRAVDLRDDLPVICKAPRALRRFMSGEYNFEEAYNRAVEAGADSTPYAKLAKFRKWLAAQETEKALGLTGGEARKKIEYELKKLSPIVENLIKNLAK